jgi:WD40 repeat protein
LLSAGADGRVRRWRGDTGEELSTSFDAHPRATMLSIAVSADGKILATSATDKTAKVWDAATNKLLATCSPDWSVLIRAALSPDGKILATGANHLRLWDAASGRSRGMLTESTVSGPIIGSVAFSPDGEWLACTGDPNRVRIWSLEDSKEKYTFAGHSGTVMAITFSADERTLASGSMDRTIKLWDMPTNKERLTLKGHEDPLSSVAFSPDGSLLVSGAGAPRSDPGRRGEVKLWDAATGKLLSDLRGHQGGVSAVASSPDGKTVASAGRDHTVRLHSASLGIARARLLSVRLSPPTREQLPLTGLPDQVTWSQRHTLAEQHPEKVLRRWEEVGR